MNDTHSGYQVCMATELYRLEAKLEENRSQGWVLDGNLIVFYNHKLQRKEYYHAMIHTRHGEWRAT